MARGVDRTVVAVLEPSRLAIPTFEEILRYGRSLGPQMAARDDELRWLEDAPEFIQIPRRSSTIRDLRDPYEWMRHIVQ